MPDDTGTLDVSTDVDVVWLEARRATGEGIGYPLPPGQARDLAQQLLEAADSVDGPDEAPACADCGRRRSLVGPVDFDGEDHERGDYVCQPCLQRRKGV